MGFKPRHVVAIVVALAIGAAMSPVVVNAATNYVGLIDGVGGVNKAKVNQSGALWTAEVDPVSKAQSKVDSSGKRLVGDGSGSLTVDGTVSSRAASPTNALDTINDLTLHSGDTRRPMFSGVGNRKIVLTSLIASAEGSTAGSVELLVVAYVKSNSVSGDCETLSGFGAAERFTVMVPVGTTENITWPTGLVWTQYADADDFYCINVESFGGPTGYTAHFSAYGYRQ